MPWRLMPQGDFLRTGCEVLTRGENGLAMFRKACIL